VTSVTSKLNLGDLFDSYDESIFLERARLSGIGILNFHVLDIAEEVDHRPQAAFLLASRH
jgi:hypothetical protein